jgi:hypothetical protein
MSALWYIPIYVAGLALCAVAMSIVSKKKAEEK